MIYNRKNINFKYISWVAVFCTTDSPVCVCRETTKKSHVIFFCKYRYKFIYVLCRQDKRNLFLYSYNIHPQH